MDLRDYQSEAVRSVFGWFTKHSTGAPLIVVPTGGGKTPILASITRKICELGTDRRVLIIAHRKELLVQAVGKLLKIWPAANIGVYSAGLGEKVSWKQVTVAGINSVYLKAREVGKVSLVIIDEAHRIRPDDEGMYNRLINELREINPAIRVLGLTATPYRLTSGMLPAPDRVFTDIAYNAEYSRLQQAGWLSKVRVKVPRIGQADLSEVGIRAGEYIERDLEKAFNRSKLINSEVTELERWGEGRKAWLVFCTTVAHAKAVSAELKERGHINEVLDADTPGLFRDEIIDKFKAGKLKCIVNVGVLTEGFDAPNVDLIGVLRATQSTGLWLQICGRGSRVLEGKVDCLVIDFGGNAKRLGTLETNLISVFVNPLNNEKIFENGTAPIRVCAACEEVVTMKEVGCTDCGLMFPVVKAEIPVPAEKAKEFEVVNVNYEIHQKIGKPPSLRVNYAVLKGEAIDHISEWVAFESMSQWARRSAAEWWRKRARDEDSRTPGYVSEALNRAGELRKPKRIKALRKDGFWRVEGLIFPDVEPIPDADKFFEETGINI